MRIDANNIQITSSTGNHFVNVNTFDGHLGMVFWGTVYNSPHTWLVHDGGNMWQMCIFVSEAHAEEQLEQLREHWPHQILLSDIVEKGDHETED